MYEQTELEVVTTQWHKEVDAEIVILIRAGYPPRDAVDRAIFIVSERRRKKSADKSGG